LLVVAIIRKEMNCSERLTWNQYLLQAGVPVQVVAQRLGHTLASTTTDVYAHVLPGMGREAAKTIERMMGGR
jgi:integrase